MIHRQNWLEVKSYLVYLADVNQFSVKTIAKRRGHLRHLLEWADETRLPLAQKIGHGFPVYLQTARDDGKDICLSAASMKGICNAARLFLTWARKNIPAYHSLPESWIDTLQPSRKFSLTADLKEHQAYSLEDVLKVVGCQAESVLQRRDIAAMCFLFLSGLRVDAFVSLPLSCVNLAEKKISQLPKLGVRTKNSKAAITYLLDIPQLYRVVCDWDQFVRQTLPADAYWYATISSDAETLSNQGSGAGRRVILARGLRKVCHKAGITYLSPHKLRHGHAVHALRSAKTIEELKAISQNLMHSSITITDSIYSVLSGADVQDRINGLGKSKDSKTLEDLAVLLQAIKENPALVEILTKKG